MGRVGHHGRLGFLPARIVASEVFRHIELLTSGQEVEQETRGFDEDKAETYSLRSKEDAPDYRYMPDPNIPPLLLTEVTLPPLNFTLRAEMITGLYREYPLFHARTPQCHPQTVTCPRSFCPGHGCPHDRGCRPRGGNRWSVW